MVSKNEALVKKAKSLEKDDDTCTNCFKFAMTWSLLVIAPRLELNGVGVFLHLIKTMAESGLSEEHLESFILNSQNVHQIPDDETIWSLQSALKAKKKAGISLSWLPSSSKTGQGSSKAQVDDSKQQLPLVSIAAAKRMQQRLLRNRYRLRLLDMITVQAQVHELVSQTHCILCKWLLAQPQGIKLLFTSIQIFFMNGTIQSQLTSAEEISFIQPLLGLHKRKRPAGKEEDNHGAVTLYGNSKLAAVLLTKDDLALLLHGTGHFVRQKHVEDSDHLCTFIFGSLTRPPEAHCVCFKPLPYFIGFGLRGVY